MLKLPIYAYLQSEPSRDGQLHMCLQCRISFYGGSDQRAAPFSEEAPHLHPHSSLWSWEIQPIFGAQERAGLQTPPPCPGLSGGALCIMVGSFSLWQLQEATCAWPPKAEEPHTIGMRVYITFCYYYIWRSPGNLGLINLGLWNRKSEKFQWTALDE